MNNGTDDFYLALENRFRGTRATIKERQSAYIPILDILRDRFCEVSAVALDLGCGRGEWMELLSEQGWIRPSGVDSNVRMVEACLETGLRATHNDLFTYLASVPSASQDIVTAFHVIEHLPLALQLSLLSEIRRILRPQGLAFIETPNPENIQVGCHTFFIDPTHTKPLPPELLQFMGEYTGFKSADILRLQPRTDFPPGTPASPFTQFLANKLCGAQDYAVVVCAQPEAHKLSAIRQAIHAINTAAQVELGGSSEQKRHEPEKKWKAKRRAIKKSIKTFFGVH
jgi:SAM-dependent methyltransferase